MTGAFITLEGGEGCGKTTQMPLLVGRLEALGADVLVLREPGGTVVGDRLREILLDATHLGRVEPRAELLMYEAARAQLVGERIRPALAQGRTVVCDRFFDSTTAYQGYGRGLDLESIRESNLAATGGLVPHATIVIDIDPRTGLERAGREGADRLESEALGFHDRVREGFLAIARSEPDRVRVVDGSGPVEEVAERVWSAVESRLRALGVLG
ncbi:MAG: dTMP kinase [Coriobacteriaceae bacterium]|nr:dTMP kinase [Coriobacteriaceae bacterium]